MKEPIKFAKQPMKSTKTNYKQTIDEYYDSYKKLFIRTIIFEYDSEDYKQTIDEYYNQFLIDKKSPVVIQDNEKSQIISNLNTII